MQQTTSLGTLLLDHIEGVFDYSTNDTPRVIEKVKNITMRQLVFFTRLN